MASQTTLQKAIEIVTKATEEDRKENYEEAFKVLLTCGFVLFYLKNNLAMISNMSWVRTGNC